MRTYTVGVNPSNGRTTFTFTENIGSFSVWRDLGRLAGLSYDNPNRQETFEFIDPSKIKEAEALLAGALWEKG